MMTRIAQAVEGIGNSFDRIAVLDDGCAHTYDLLAEAVEVLAAELLAAGVRPGERVAVYIRFGYRSLLAALAVNYAGAVAIPLDIRETCTLTERKLRVADAHWALGHVADNHIVEDVVGVDDPPMSTVAGDYTLVGLANSAARSEPPAGFVFCSPEGSLCRVVDAGALTATARTVAGQWGIGADDTVGLGLELGAFETFLAAVATLISGATLSLTDRAEEGGAASVLVHADFYAQTLPEGAGRTCDGLSVALFGRRTSALLESAGNEVRELRFPTRSQGRADSGQIRRWG
ncbi:AMP-binding protein [Nocardia sp. XZ_19_385]|uniref:AMP-binding protein n=1 Tax=Nocardia sp. XZ_19_385 TaxID=2769488 RepID=UPI00188ED9FE|nr:AMP-binding protein [Nocardia sp. XZ_19_385]